MHLKKMIELSEILSKGFPFVRIDFYDLPENPLLGEMTFYPTGGMQALKPDKFDREQGELFIIPENKLLKIQALYSETLTAYESYGSKVKCYEKQLYEVTP